MLRLLIAFFTFIIGLSNVKGQTFCIITHCGWETTQCVLDPKCWEVLTCLQVIKMEFNFSVFKSTYFQASIKWVRMNKWGEINFSSNFNKWVGTFI